MLRGCGSQDAFGCDRLCVSLQADTWKQGSYIMHNENIVLSAQAKGPLHLRRNKEDRLIFTSQVSCYLEQALKETYLDEAGAASSSSATQIHREKTQWCLPG